MELKKSSKTGIKKKITSEKAIAIIPCSLFGIERRIA
jgi:hypothetical protein